MGERFGPALSSAEIDTLLEGALNKNTERATTVWLRAVTSFRKEKGLDLSFATCSAQELSDFLCQFYASVRPQKAGVEYSKSSYLAARAAIQRHLRVLKRPFNIFTDEAFSRSNEVLNALLIQKKKDGLHHQVKHKEAILPDDMAKLAVYFEDVLSSQDPRKLTQYCWFVITIHF